MPDAITTLSPPRVLPALLVAAVTVVACHGGGEKPKSGEPAKATSAAGGQVPQTVSVAQAAPMQFERRIAVSGEVRPREDVIVNAATSGVRVLELLVDTGDYVKKGQTLARLDLGIVRAQLDSASAQVGRAEAALQNAQVGVRLADSEYQRALSVKDTGALSDEAIEQRRAQADSARAQVALAEAEVRVARAARAEIEARATGGEVRSPAAGLIIERNIRVGEMVGVAPLFRIVGNNQLEVAAEVAEGDITAMTRGLTASFELADGRTVTGRLRRPPASLDTRRRVGIALFDLPADNALKSGLYLKGFVTQGQQEGLGIPVSALAYVDGQPHAYVLGEGDVVRRTALVLGPQQGDRVAVLSGLEAGQAVAAGGVAFLQDGDPVTRFTPQAIPAPDADKKP